MAEESAIADFYLELWATQIKDALNSDDPFRMHLFQNDYHPVPGVDLADLTEADFDGYNSVELSGTWGSVAVIANVATTVFSTACEFTVDAGEPDSQTIYGYWLQDSDDNLVDVVRFENPRILWAYDVLSVTAVLRVLNPASA